MKFCSILAMSLLVSTSSFASTLDIAQGKYEGKANTWKGKCKLEINGNKATVEFSSKPTIFTLGAPKKDESGTTYLEASGRFSREGGEPLVGSTYTYFTKSDQVLRIDLDNADVPEKVQLKVTGITLSLMTSLTFTYNCKNLVKK